MLALVLWHQGSSAFFIHTHNINGSVIVHSHPFSERTGGNNHSHTVLQILTIALLSTIAAIIGLSVVIAGLLFTKDTQYKLYTQRFIPHCILLTPSLRGPPVH